MKTYLIPLFEVFGSPMLRIVLGSAAIYLFIRWFLFNQFPPSNETGFMITLLVSMAISRLLQFIVEHHNSKTSMRSGKE